MKILSTIAFSFLFFYSSLGQSLNGKWQGVLIRAGQKMEKGTLFYADFEINDGKVTGITREEVFNTELFAVKQISGTAEGNEIIFKQIVVQKKSKSSRTKWCRISTTLHYDPETGFLTGDYKSTDCKRNMGTIKLYRADFELSEEEKAGTSHLWFAQLIKDEKEGFNAPEIRKKERDNFVFEPVFFDFDKYVIREEHKDFLLRLIRVVKGHSDLRVRVTGHTDSDGTHGYNDTLSKNRAEAIVNFFVENGLRRDRLEFDFKGETQPADTNNTSQGKQRNRRVDFSFI